MLKLILNENYQLDIESYRLDFQTDDILYIEIQFQSNEGFDSLKTNIGLYYNNNNIFIKDDNDKILLNIQGCKLNMLQRNLNQSNNYFLEFYNPNYNIKEVLYEIIS